MENTPLDRFKSNFMTLIDICHEMIEEGCENGIDSITPSMFNIIKIIASKLKPEYLMERFIRKTNQHWDKIKAKDLDYFKNIGVHFLNLADSSGIDNVIPDEDKGVLGGLKMNHVNSFAEFLNGKYTDEQGNEVHLLDDERISDVWKIMHSFVKQAITFIHEKREIVDGQPTVEYFSEINLQENIESWKIKKLIN